MIKEEQKFKPTFDKPMSDQSKAFEKNFKKTMTNSNVKLNEVDGILSEAEQSLKKKIFSLAKMEALVFSDPKLTSVYNQMAENGEEKYGYHYNETIMNMIFNDYVLNSPTYLQKYKMAIPKEKKRRDASGINQLKKAGEKEMKKKVNPVVSKPKEPTGLAEADEPLTDVLFLVNEKDPKNPDLFAYFPNDIHNGVYRMAYSHVGQHSSAHPKYAAESRQATPEEYADLKAELESIGYNLKVLNGANETTGAGSAGGFAPALGFKQKPVKEQETEEVDEPQEDDCFISSNGFKYKVSCGGKFQGEFVEMDGALATVKKWKTDNNWFPNTWFISDHGNLSLIDDEGNILKESTTAGSAGGSAGYVGYAGPSAWGSGDLMKTKGKSNIMRKPIWQGGTIISESNYLIESDGFEKFINSLDADSGPSSQAEPENVETDSHETDKTKMTGHVNATSTPSNKIAQLGKPFVEKISNKKEAADLIIDKTTAFTSDVVKGWNEEDTDIELDMIKTGQPDKPNLNLVETEIDEKAKSKSQQRFMGMVHAVQKGELSADKVGGKVEKAAASMSDKDAEDFASTKHKGLPEKVDEYLMPDALISSDIVDIQPRTGEKPFEMNGSKWVFETATFKDGRKDIVVYSYQNDVYYDYEKWRKAMNIKENNLKEDAQSMIGDSPDTMAFKPEAAGTVSKGGIPIGMQSIGGGMNESDSTLESANKLLEELNNELEAFSIHHNKLKKMNEDRKTSSLVMKDRLGGDNEANFKKDLQHSGTKEIIDVQKELQYKDQQTDVGDDPQKLGQDLENKELEVTDAKSDEALKNVGNSANDKGDELPKRNFTKEEQDEVDMYRLGQHSLVYDNEPGKRFEDRMKADMGDDIYKMRQKQLEFRGKAPMYNKDPQPVEDTTSDKVQFNKEQSGWNERIGLKETMITGRFVDSLGKKYIKDFRLDEVIELKTPSGTARQTGLFELDFTGFGNKYKGKTQDKKVIVNEGVENILSENKFYTDGVKVFVMKNPVQKLNENEQKVQKSPVNEQYNKMKHLLDYKPKDFVNTNNVKKNRGF